MVEIPKEKCTIHIAPDLNYLFSRVTQVLCGRFTEEIFASGEFVGIKDNLNPKCFVCSECLEKSELELQQGVEENGR